MWRSIVCLAFFAQTAAAADSGPKPGEKVEPFTVFGVVGPVEDQEADFVADRKDAPTIYLFIQHAKFDRPMARFMKGLDALGDNDRKLVAIWLTDDGEGVKKGLPRVQMSLQFQNTALTVFKDTNGPNGWSLNGDAHVTVVVARQGKVVASFGFQSVNETDVEAVKKSLGATK
jgi:hypothetical protein